MGTILVLNKGQLVHKKEKITISLGDKLFFDNETNEFFRFFINKKQEINFIECGEVYFNVQEGLAVYELNKFWFDQFKYISRSSRILEYLYLSEILNKINVMEEKIVLLENETTTIVAKIYEEEYGHGNV